MQTISVSQNRLVLCLCLLPANFVAKMTVVMKKMITRAAKLAMATRHGPTRFSFVDSAVGQTLQVVLSSF